MPRLLVNLIAPLLPAIIPLILLVACATTPAHEAEEACEAAEKGQIDEAREAADKAYADLDRLPLESICRLAASYAVITLSTGDEEAAQRFHTAYTLSMASDPAAARKVYDSLDPQMADGLEIIAGLLDGSGIYTTAPAAVDSIRDATDATALSEN